VKYNVHLYVPARVKIEGIEAESQEQAVTLAIEKFNPSDFFNNDADSRDAAQWDEGATLGALVDEVGDEDYDNSRYHPLDGGKNYLTVDPYPEQEKSA
jgi:hypothetical protein